MSTYEDYKARHRANWGSKFDASEIDSVHPLFHYYFGKSSRVIVERVYEDGETYRRVGRISGTGGWKPALILMARADSIGSGDVISSEDRIIAVRDSNGVYRSVKDNSVVKVRA